MERIGTAIIFSRKSTTYGTSNNSDTETTTTTVSVEMTRVSKLRRNTRTKRTKGRLCWPERRRKNTSPPPLQM